MRFLPAFSRPWPFVRRAKVAAILAELRQVEASLDAQRTAASIAADDRDVFRAAMKEARDEAGRLREAVGRMKRGQSAALAHLGFASDAILTAMHITATADNAADMSKPMGLKGLPR